MFYWGKLAQSVKICPEGKSSEVPKCPPLKMSIITIAKVVYAI